MSLSGVNSIRGRLLLWAVALTAGALLVAWLVLSSLLSDFVERRLAAELGATARAVMAASDWNALGAFAVSPTPADPRFEQPLSGWYWQVADGAQVLARAPALVTGDLGLSGRGVTGPDGAPLTTHVKAFTAPGDGRALTVTVSLPAAEAAAELAAITQPLLLALAVLGASLLGAQIVAVRAGLADLDRFARSVASVRDGTARKVLHSDVAELRPLAQELDRLIAANAAQIARARAHAGDLAHALKTPLAVLGNRAGPADAALIDRMDRTIRWHLKRARAGAKGIDPIPACAVAPVLDDVVMVLTPEARRRGVALSVETDNLPDFRGDAEDLTEIVGTLAENAVQWATSKVSLSASVQDNALVIRIADDGPGIPPADRDRLLGRGVRLDETTHGYGLGLAIAADRAQACGGDIGLGSSETGGLLVEVTLPIQT